MEKDKLHKAQNYFIKLKNEGRSLDEIISIFSDIPRNILEEWNEKLDAALIGLEQVPMMNQKITELDDNGEYLIERTFNFRVGPLEHGRFSLMNILSNIENNESVPESFKELVKKTSNVFNNDLAGLELSFKEDYSYNAKFNLKREDVDVKEVEKAIEFYIKHIYSYENRRKERTLLHEASKDIFTHASKILTRSIKSIAIQNYHGLRDVTIRELPIDAQWIFITGENSRGKSSLLQAIFIGLNGDSDGDRLLLNESNSKIAIEYKSGNSNVINNIGSRIEPLHHLLAYGPSRLLIQANSSQNDESAYGLKHYSLFHPDGKLMNIEFSLLLWHFEKPSRFEIVKEIICSILPHLKDFRYDSATNQILYKDGDAITAENNGLVAFSQLASGSRSIIAMVGDMICRIFGIEPKLDDPRQFSGIVLIDELDVHLHPKLQRRLPTLLSQVFPDIQFIVTTHSVIPFLGAPQNSVFLKVSKQKDEDTTVERILINIKNLLPNVLLTSSLFDMDNITQINKEDIQQVSTEDSFEEYSKVQDIKRKLDNLENSDLDFPEIN